MKVVNPEDDDSAETQAITWCVRLTSGEITQEELREFERWRQASPEHEVALTQARQLWLSVGNRLDTHDFTLVSAVPTPVEPRRSRLRRAMRPMAAAAVVVLAVSAVFQWQADWRYQYATQGGEQKTVQLSDGSHAWLNTGTALNVDMRDGQRFVRLARGEAFFDVTHDEARPFIVDTGGSRVRVLGTAFAVQRDGDDTVVTVQRGRVRVSGDRAGQVEIVPNQRVRVHNGQVAEQVEQVNAEQKLAWHEGRLMFQDATVAEIIQTLKRYDRRLVFSHLAGSDKVRLSTMIELRRLDDWYDTLEQTTHIQVTRLGPVVWLH